MSITRLLLAIFFIGTIHLYASDSTYHDFKYSKIIDIPDLSFLEKFYSGLDILEQMDFKPLKKKSIAILTNQSAVNRNGKHLLDILKMFPDIKVSFLLSMEHGIWSIDDNRSKMIGRDGVEPRLLISLKLICIHLIG